MLRILLALAFTLSLAAQTPAQQASMMQGMTQAIERQMKLVDDPQVAGYVTRVARSIARNSTPPVPIGIKLVEDDSIDILFPGNGFLYVYTGLIRKVENEPQLAAALAYGIAHVSADTASLFNSRLVKFETACQPTVERPPSPPQSIVFMKPSCEQEMEADTRTIQYLHKTGYDPSGFVGLLEKIRAEEKSKKGARDRIKAANSFTEDRIADAKKYIKKKLTPGTNYLPATPEFSAMQARIQGR